MLEMAILGNVQGKGHVIYMKEGVEMEIRSSEADSMSVNEPCSRCDCCLRRLSRRMVILVWTLSRSRDSIKLSIGM